MKTALITGTNKGLGLEFVRQLKQKGYYIIGCCRNPDRATALNQLADVVIPLEVTDDNDIINLKTELKGRPIDLLVNNAGTSGETGVTVGNINRDNFLQVLNVNCLSVLKLTDALLDNIEASEEKSILVVSSQMGSISDNNSGASYAYRSSKAALNCAMHSFALDVKSRGIRVMLIHPGWVKTDMGGPNALVTIPESITGILHQAAQYMTHSHAGELRRFDGGVIGW